MHAIAYNVIATFACANLAVLGQLCKPNNKHRSKLKSKCSISCELHVDKVFKAYF